MIYLSWAGKPKGKSLSKQMRKKSVESVYAVQCRLIS